MDLAAVVRALQALLTLQDTSGQCGGPGINVSTFCTDSVHVFSKIMYISARNMDNEAAKCTCRVSATENAPLYISLVGTPTTGCDSKIRVIGGEKRFTITCNDEEKGDIVFVKRGESATITFTRTSAPTTMCTTYYIADGTASVTMTCYKTGDGLTTTTLTPTTTSTATISTPPPMTTTTTLPTTTTSTTAVTITLPTTTTTLKTTSASTLTTNSNTSTHTVTTQTTTTVPVSIETTDKTTEGTTEDTQTEKSADMPVALIAGSVGGFVILLGIIVIASIMCGFKTKRTHRITPENMDPMSRHKVASHKLPTVPA